MTDNGKRPSSPSTAALDITSINAAFAERGTGPYSLAFKVKIVAVKPAEVYWTDGEEKRVMHFAMSDGNTTAKGICCDAAKIGKVQVGNTLIVRNTIRRTEDEGRVLILTSASKVLMSVPLQVPPQHVKDGERLLNPPPAEIEDEPREVPVQGGMISIKTITVQDDSSKTQVTLA
ncbi:uncharacterized protein LOC127852570 [Dreissena polymorpha]|uniref:uncharacterized protein LOC127852570 n=1 Tax=Dreissena polymorpha TaxID=45954 RepID=UPI0022646166|nr:uncharacterized protein LOC127852570 [Dreissena polymorpha]